MSPEVWIAIVTGVAGIGIATLEGLRWINRPERSSVAITLSERNFADFTRYMNEMLIALKESTDELKALRFSIDSQTKTIDQVVGEARTAHRESIDSHRRTQQQLALILDRQERGR